MAISDLLIELPAPIKYLIFLAALAGDTVLQAITGLSFSKFISGTIKVITGFDFGLDAPKLLFLGIIFGGVIFMVYFQSSVGKS